MVMAMLRQLIPTDTAQQLGGERDLRSAVRLKQRQLDVSQQNSVAPTAYCFVTWMLFAPVVSVNPAV
jgi:hypothetical protein